MAFTFKDYLINEDEIIAAIEENRAPPPSMNYSFDEIDPDVDAKSYSRSRRERLQGNDSPDYDREMGFQKHAQNKARGYDDDSGMEHMMMHGTEDEEAKIPARRDRNMGNIRRDLEGENNSSPNIKRAGQRAHRALSRTRGIGNPAGKQWDEEEENQQTPANIDRYAGRLEQRNKETKYSSQPNTHRTSQRAGRSLRRRYGVGNPSGAGYEEAEETNLPAQKDRAMRYRNAQEIDPDSKRAPQAAKRTLRTSYGIGHNRPNAKPAGEY